jgi:hypothetical protein
MNGTINTIVSPCTGLGMPQLTSLTIHDCHLQTKHLESLLSLTPSLIHLKLIFFQRLSGLKSDGIIWKSFIQEKLPFLSKFEFFFAYTYSRNYDTHDLKTIVAPFRTRFWLKDKHWFVAVDYNLISSRFTIYTVPICIADFEIGTRCTILSKDNVCRIISRSTTDMLGNIRREVRYQTVKAISFCCQDLFPKLLIGFFSLQ